MIVVDLAAAGRGILVFSSLRKRTRIRCCAGCHCNE